MIKILITIITIVIFIGCGGNTPKASNNLKTSNVDFAVVVDKILKTSMQYYKKAPKEINLRRGEFEKSIDFQERVKKTKAKYKEDVQKYTKNYLSYRARVKKEAIKIALQYTWGKPKITNLKYDADRSYFIADISFDMKKDFQKKVAIKVNNEEAKSFKKNVNKLKVQAIFEFENNIIKLKDIKIPYRGKTYLAQFTDLSIDDTRVAVNISDDINSAIEINDAVILTKNSVDSFDFDSLKNPKELDNLLKNSKQVKTDKTKWLFVIGIENYEYTSNISYAKRSAEMFAKIAYKKLGVKKSNSFIMINNGATQAKIKTNMKRMLRRVKTGDTIYFYYNGHGIPIPSLKNKPFMLASDSEPDFVADEKFFSLQNIYNQLSNSKASKIVAIVDSCFSGVTDAKPILRGVAATKMVAKSVTFNKEKMVVLTAGKGNQYSNGYDKKSYRLFSFYIMKNILKGNTTIKQLYKDTKEETYNTSIEEYGDNRTQEPTIDGNFRLNL